MTLVSLMKIIYKINRHKNKFYRNFTGWADVKGVDLSLRTTIDYYFTDSFSLDTGLGFSGNVHTIKSSGDPNGNYSVFYITVPLGLRFVEPSCGLTFGAGITANMPIYTSGKFQDYNIESFPHMGWYVDLGIEFGDVFEILFRGNIAFDKAAEFYNLYESEPVEPIFLGLVLRFPIRLGNFSIGDNN